MKNILNKYPVYKGKSVMIVETSIGVNYGEANPFIQIKFAPRADSNSNGVWEDANCFWLTSYAELYNFVAGMKNASEQKVEKFEMKNPKKGVTLSIRYSKGSDETEYISFGFFRGDTKIQVSLLKANEFPAFFAYYSNLLANYNTVCATALLRNDIWYEFVGKNKQGGQGADKPASTGRSSGQGYKSTPKQQTPPAASPDGPDDDFSGNNMGDDVPF